MLIIDYNSSVSPYIKQVGAIQYSLGFLGVEEIDVTCTPELYNPFNQGLAVRFNWYCPKFDRYEEELFCYAVSLMENKNPIEPDPKEKLKYELWHDLTSWKRYKDNGGPTIWLNKLNFDELYDLLCSLKPFLRNEESLIEILEEKNSKESTEKAVIKKINLIFEHIKKLESLSIKARCLKDIIEYTKKGVLARCVAGNYKDSKELAEISLIIKQIKNYSQETSELVSDYRAVCESMKVLKKRYEESYWTVRDLPGLFEH